jgi:hypothetical protein
MDGGTARAGVRRREGEFCGETPESPAYHSDGAEGLPRVRFFPCSPQKNSLFDGLPRWWRA